MDQFQIWLLEWTESFAADDIKMASKVDRIEVLHEQIPHIAHAQVDYKTNNFHPNVLCISYDCPADPNPSFFQILGFFSLFLLLSEQFLVVRKERGPA